MRNYRKALFAGCFVLAMALTACGTKEAKDAQEAEKGVKIENTAVSVTGTGEAADKDDKEALSEEGAKDAQEAKKAGKAETSGTVRAAEVPEWDAESIYVGGDRVLCKGVLYEASWWTQGENPAKQTDEWGVWKPVAEDSKTTVAVKPEEKDEEEQQDTESAGTTKPSETKAPDSPKTSDSPKPSAITKTKLAKHTITGYWQNFDNGAKCLKISEVPKGYNLIAVAFAESTDTPGKVTFCLDENLSRKLGGYTKKQFIKDIKAAKKKGQRVIISVGGEVGNVSVTNAAEAKAFADSVYKLMKEYGFDGVDIDLEHGINAKYMEKALRRLSKKAGKDLIITMAPQTLDMQNTKTEYFKLALKIKDILTMVNMQYYNSGSMLGADGKVYAQGDVDFLTALAAIQLEHGLKPEQVGLGLPASKKGAGSGYVSPKLVNKAVNCLAKGKKGGDFKPKKKYPKLRGVMTWSINWDAANGYQFLKTVEPVIKKLP